MPDIYLKYTEAIDWYVDYIKNERTPGPEVRGGGDRAPLPQLAGGAPPAGRDHPALLRAQAGDRLQGLRRHPADLLHRLQRRGRGAEGLRARQAAQRRRPVRRIAVRQVAQGGALPGAHRPDQGVGEDHHHHQAPAAVDGERGEGHQQGAHGLPRRRRRHRDGHRNRHRARGATARQAGREDQRRSRRSWTSDWRSTSSTWSTPTPRIRARPPR